ncbi:MAG: SNARE-binding exocyst subunit S6 [Lichina confinis]|nr:MAG: SNARE-binding exocyst subunit S6 [Lichina confinis]
MNDADGIPPKLADLLRHPNDLDKIPALKSEFTRKKAAIDGHLKEGLKEQLDITQAGMSSISDGQRTVQLVKEEMMKIDRLCAEAQSLVTHFPQIGLVSQTHRNFAMVEAMRSNLDSFNGRVAAVEALLRLDDDDLENMPNFLSVHYELSQLRNIRDEAMDQIKKTTDASLQSTLEDFFARLEEPIGWFDEHVGLVCLNMISLVQNGNNGLVVRLAIIVEEEERNDKKIRAMQEAQKEYKELAARFKSITTGPKELRGYKEKFLECIRAHAQEQFDKAIEQFLDDPDRLEKSMRWFFNDLNTVKLGMVALMPKKWRIFRTYGDIYHGLMHDNLVRLIDDPELKPPQMLAIVHWVDKYYAKMARLGYDRRELGRHVIDDRAGELIQEWRQLIVKFLDEWISRIFEADRKEFGERSPDTLDRDENGCFRTRNVVDMWRMLREQTLVAAASRLNEVTEGVIDAMLRVLRTRQSAWQKMVDDECARYANANAGTSSGSGSGSGVDQDGYQTLQDWLVAVANDQIACIDDNEDAGQLGYLTRFRRDFEGAVSSAYLAQASGEVEALRNGYVDLSTHCITCFTKLVFVVDLRSTLADFFTGRWYGEAGMARIVSTFEDYLNDYAQVLHRSMFDILVEELADTLLERYLGGVRNKGAKFRRTVAASASASGSASPPDPYEAKLRDDVLTAFAFFERFPAAFGAIKAKWRVVDWFSRLIAADKHALPALWIDFRAEHPDAHLSWLEAVLRARDDFDRATLNAVKARVAAEPFVPPHLPPSSPSAAAAAGAPQETIMSKVR